MDGHVRHSSRERAAFALRHPGMAWDRLRGREVRDISLAKIARYLPPAPVILEAGACDGTDTARFARYWSGAAIHAFEPVPALYAETAQRTAELPGVRLYPLALAGRAGPVTMHVVDPGPGGNRGKSSLRPSVRGIATQVQAVTVAGWAAAEGISRVDFMWLDLEGLDLEVIKAAGQILRTVRAVHMEVRREPFRVGADTPLYPEVVAWMRAQGFRIAIDRAGLWFGNVLFVPD